MDIQRTPSVMEAGYAVMTAAEIKRARLIIYNWALSTSYADWCDVDFQLEIA